ncbi:hypothetical protein ACFW4X_10795 [Streptomyces smyrnaeus]|uniref:hypothetical protein n=1 Tax=Streptomyces smyrnaeus TaxID=1387713 RepID=UPI0036A65AF0
MATSRAGAAIDALLSILRAAPALADVAVVDGPPTQNLTKGKRLYVGWSPASDQAADITQSFASAGARRRDEDFSIACYLEVRSGDTDMAAKRASAFTLLAAVEDVLRATDSAPEAPTLDGTVLWSQLTAAGLDQDQTQNGALAGIPFTVTCRARI